MNARLEAVIQREFGRAAGELATCGALKRFGFGLWQREGPRFDCCTESFSTVTIEWMLNHGHAIATKWREHPDGRQPILVIPGERIPMIERTNA